MKALKTTSKLTLDTEQIQDVINFHTGVYAPLTGFLTQKEFTSVLNCMRLPNGDVWPIPIVLDISAATARKIREYDKILLVDDAKTKIGYLLNPEVYCFDKKLYAQAVFQTTDQSHPGVTDIYNMHNYLIGGKIVLTNKPKQLFDSYCFSPSAIKKQFKKNGWQTIVGFQTRNVPHRGHEYLHQQALKIADGLLIQPVIGKKKVADFKDEYIMGAYTALIKKYYPRHRVMLAALPFKMRYAGPREAVMHALIRRSFGCTHFIVGRDHAGVGNYYQPFAAQEIFDQFSPADLGINILKYEEVVYNNRTKNYGFVSRVPQYAKIHFSATRLRQYLANDLPLPNYLVRPEVAKLLTSSPTALVEDLLPQKMRKPGFVLWLIGLSGSGKTTVADKVYQLLRERQVLVERLDGDVARQSLTKDLGFSQKDRLENIKRLGFVANLLSKNGVGVIASFITPYQEQRGHLRQHVKNYIEVYINTPLKICEKRDPKGFYAKARKGEIKNFTGISDPFELPHKPELTISALEADPTAYAETILQYLIKQKYI